MRNIEIITRCSKCKKNFNIKFELKNWIKYKTNDNILDLNLNNDETMLLTSGSCCTCNSTKDLENNYIHSDINHWRVDI